MDKGDDIMKRKHISFEHHEEKLLDYALQQDYFPNYVKKLIEYDMEHGIFRKSKSMKKRNIYDIYNEKASR
jgi:hypothetical protein